MTPPAFSLCLCGSIRLAWPVQKRSLPMRQFSISLATLMVTLVCCQALAGEAEFKTLEGTWEITELIVGGEKVPDKDLAGMKFVFSTETDKDVKIQKLTLVPPSSDTSKVDKRTFSLTFDAKKK